MTDLGRQVDAEKRQLRSMRQYRDLPEAEIDAMALDRIRTGKTSGRRAPTADAAPSADTESSMDYLGLYCRDTGVGLLDADPWFISAWQGTEPGVDDDQSQLPARQYEAYVMTLGGRRYLCLALDWRPL